MVRENKRQMDDLVRKQHEKPGGGKEGAPSSGQAKQGADSSKTPNRLTADQVRALIAKAQRETVQQTS